MSLNVLLGATVVCDIVGHSASDGAPIPDSATVKLGSNDPTVATVPDTVTVPAGGTQVISNIPITVVAAGSTDITADATTSDGTVFHAAATLIVATPVPGLASIELVLREVTVTPPPPSA